MPGEVTVPVAFQGYNPLVVLWNHTDNREEPMGCNPEKHVNCDFIQQISGGSPLVEEQIHGKVERLKALFQGFQSLWAAIPKNWRCLMWAMQSAEMALRQEKRVGLGN